MNTKYAERMLAISNAEIRRIDRTDFFGYNQIQNAGVVDYLTPIVQQAQINDSYAMWIKNPLAKFIIDIVLDYVWNEGLTFNAKEMPVQEVMNDFYFDIDNSWDSQGEKRIQDLFIYGELGMKLFVSDNMGKVKVSSVFPGLINNVFMDKENSEKIDAISVTRGDNDPEIFKILTYDDLAQTYEGDFLFYRINNTIHQPRGLSDLFVRRDWLKLYDKSLFSTMDRAGLLLSFVWDVTVKDAKEPELRRKLKEIQTNPPKPGSVRLHNDKETWKDLSPDLNGSDFDDIYRLLRSQSMGGIPEFMWGLGGNANLATATAQGEPFFRKMKRRQRFVINMFQDMFDYQIWQSVQHGVLPEKMDKTYALSLPEPNKQFAATFAESVLKFSQALLVLETNNYIEKETADAVVSMLFNLMGVKTSTGETQEDTDTTKKKDGQDDKLVNFYNKFRDKLKGSKKVKRV